jgi:hypothetical protein
MEASRLEKLDLPAAAVLWLLACNDVHFDHFVD